MIVFQLWSGSVPQARIDVFVEEPFDFAAEFARAARCDLAGLQVPVLSLPALIAMKRAAGRDQDLVDARKLEALQKLQGESDNVPHA